MDTRSIGPWILYPRSDGSSVHPISKKNAGGCFYTTTISKDVGSYIQGPMDRVSIIELKECWRMSLHHNNIKGCWILYPRSGGSRVHHRAKRMLEDVFTPQQYQTCWISDPKSSRVSMQTYKFNDQSYKWRELFSGRFSGSGSCKYLGVYGKDVNRRMVWRIGGKLFTSSKKNL